MPIIEAQNTKLFYFQFLNILRCLVSWFSFDNQPVKPKWANWMPDFRKIQWMRVKKSQNQFVISFDSKLFHFSFKTLCFNLLEGALIGLFFKFFIISDNPPLWNVFLQNCLCPFTLFVIDICNSAAQTWNEWYINQSLKTWQSCL